MRSVTIDEDVYERLVEDSAFLNALEAAGVDNWDGYAYAIELMQQVEGMNGN